MFLNISMPFDFQLGRRLRSFALAICGGVAALLAVYLAPTYPGPWWNLESVASWLAVSFLLVLVPSLIGLLTPKWPATPTFILGAVLGYAYFEVLLFSARVWGPFDTFWFRYLFFG
jgi:hypothetical protein